MPHQQATRKIKGQACVKKPQYDWLFWNFALAAQTHIKSTAESKKHADIIESIGDIIERCPNTWIAEYLTALMLLTGNVTQCEYQVLLNHIANCNADGRNWKVISKKINGPLRANLEGLKLHGGFFGDRYITW